MLKRYLIQSVIAAFFFVAVALLGVTTARASAVQITLSNLVFDSSSGSEVFNGSFLVDTVTNEVIFSSISISATGVVLLDSFGVDLTGYEPFQFALDDGLGDALFLNLSSGLSSLSYAFGDSSIFPDGFLAGLGFSFESASSGSFSVSGAGIAPTPEPGSGMLLLTGLLLLLVGQAVRRRKSVSRWSLRASQT